jgi:Ribosomal protein L7/L12 C-terminal domain
MTDNEIRELLLAGKKIEAIKQYRQAKGLGLKEAKDAVEIIEYELRKSGQLPQKSGGCFGLFLLLIAFFFCLIFR